MHATSHDRLPRSSVIIGDHICSRSVHPAPEDVIEERYIDQSTDVPSFKRVRSGVQPNVRSRSFKVMYMITNPPTDAAQLNENIQVSRKIDKIWSPQDSRHARQGRAMACTREDNGPSTWHRLAIDQSTYDLYYCQDAHDDDVYDEQRRYHKIWPSHKHICYNIDDIAMS